MLFLCKSEIRGRGLQIEICGFFFFLKIKEIGTHLHDEGRACVDRETLDGVLEKGGFVSNGNRSGYEKDYARWEEGQTSSKESRRMAPAGTRPL